MASLNKIFMIGNLTRDPELRYVPSGAPVATFGLAVNRTFVTQHGDKKDEVCFVRVVVFGKQAESCSQYLTKGRPVFVEGRLQYRAWEQDGQKRSTLDIVADRVQFLGAPQAKQGSVSEEMPESHKETFTEEAPF
ncbi:MAG: single-stranded DNA-binding protein [Candidatus Omnitrophica bacterium CG_4_9_14_0_2_um_filter_42_8]|nr:MAG: single-stranded DNA-binding protein [Candidatus Omnitrophica bacterium CG22_combo_CG10-13_8_21_14_all_43_16]PJC47076.1 MAG: single-stranded DNA-binding protein [Candidatus Omnitrophica bacterium CG_4_9_14_0_2_um_filter_42_8]